MRLSGRTGSLNPMSRKRAFDDVGQWQLASAFAAEDHSLACDPRLGSRAGLPAETPVWRAHVQPGPHRQCFHSEVRLPDKKDSTANSKAGPTTRNGTAGIAQHSSSGSRYGWR